MRENRLASNAHPANWPRVYSGAQGICPGAYTDFFFPPMTDEKPPIAARDKDPDRLQQAGHNQPTLIQPKVALWE